MVIHFKKLLLVALLSSISLLGYAQKRAQYFVYLKDKKGSPYSLKKAKEFLSPRAIERRKKFNIAIKESDLPVNPAYISRLKATGATVWYSSRWMNAVLLEASEEALAKVKALDFVKPELTLAHPKGFTPAKETRDITPQQDKKYELELSDSSDYGAAWNQTKMLGAEEMHKAGYRGQGMVIAILDAGFLNTDKLSFFRHLYERGRILGTYNFVENTDGVYHVGDHGTKVLSTIAAYKKGEIIGTAPEASFYLFRTEDGRSEYRVEEINWLMAAERADSLGVDVINSSLGYTTFDDKKMNYTYKNLDGNTALITRAADYAAGTGMLVVTSAGNEGGGSWQYMGTPADADSILAVGAVNARGKYIYFSSTGPTSDGRVKPNVSAKGASATVVSPGDFVSASNGTSFSSPIMCGFASAFWQANPNLTNMQIIQYLQASGNQAAKPDTLLGYGIPNFRRAQELVKKDQEKKKSGLNIKSKPSEKSKSQPRSKEDKPQGQDQGIKE